MKRTLLAASLMLTVSLSHAGTSMSQSNAFTYQGQLSASGSAANGNYDMTFALFDAATGGNQVGATVLASQYPVAAGLFTIDLKFPGAFTGQQLWTEVTINGETLTPRQPVNAVPVTSFALTGTMGPMGSTGATGATGLTGATGPSGDVGATGATGTTGAAGAPGTPGGTGATGPAGLAGTAPFKFDSLVNLDDYLTINALLPPTIAPGSVFTMVVHLDSRSDQSPGAGGLPGNMAGHGIAFLCTGPNNSGQLYDLGPWAMTGPVGPAGPTGPTGGTGPTGPTGPAG